MYVLKKLEICYINDVDDIKLNISEKYNQKRYKMQEIPESCRNNKKAKEPHVVIKLERNLRRE